MRKANSNLLPIFLAFFIFLHLIYAALTTKGIELDSIAYHIPLAQKFITGTVFSRTGFLSPLQYYPAATEAILAFITYFRIPTHVFNVFGLLSLFIATYLYSRRVVLAVAVIALPVWYRIVTTQSVDVWLVSYIVYIVGILESGTVNHSRTLLLGVFFGMLLGTKYSGFLYMCAIIGIYFQQFRHFITSILHIILLIIPILFLGLPWYIRNSFFVGNPFYPFGTEFSPTHWTSLTLMLGTESGLWKILESIFSEFSAWGLLIFMFPFLIVRFRISLTAKRFLFLGFINSLFFLILPSSPQGTVSSMRYLSAGIVPLIIGFVNAGIITEYFYIAVILTTLPQLSFHPKLGIISVLLSALYQKRHNAQNEYENKNIREANKRNNAKRRQKP